MPELLQEDMTVGNVRRALKWFIADGEVRRLAESRLAETTALLRSDGDSITKIVGFLV